MMYLSYKCYIPSFLEIGPLVPEKKSVEGFLPYMDMVAVLVMLTNKVLLINLYFQLPKTNIWPSGI